MSEPACDHACSIVAATDALLHDVNGKAGRGELHWCPACGALRPARARIPIGAWMLPGSTSAQAEIARIYG